MSGQNKGINNTIKKINEIISENKLNLIHPIRLLDDTRDFDSEYGDIVDKISEVIGELRGLTLEIAGKKGEKRKKYKEDIKELKSLRDEMKNMRKTNI